MSKIRDSDNRKFKYKNSNDELELHSDGIVLPVKIIWTIILTVMIASAGSYHEITTSLGRIDLQIKAIQREVKDITNDLASTNKEHLRRIVKIEDNINDLSKDVYKNNADISSLKWNRNGVKRD